MREALIVWGGWNGHEPQQGAEIIRDFSMRMVSQFASRGLFAPRSTTVSPKPLRVKPSFSGPQDL
jgi:type 1 glutamine amidotransferase